MTDPAAVLDRIDAAAMTLDAIEKAIDAATQQYLDAEDAWFKVYDPVADTLKEEMADEGRKGDPAEHTIIREARKANRPVWARYRRAKKNLDALARRQEAAKSALSGWQSQRKALNAESDLSYGGRPTQTFGSRAA